MGAKLYLLNGYLTCDDGGPAAIVRQHELQKKILEAEEERGWEWERK